MLRFLTAGESHGPALVAILEGLPAGLELSVEEIDRQLRRRQKGYGRGGRMKIEKDHVRILSGVRFGRTLGSPLALVIEKIDLTVEAPALHGGEDPLRTFQCPYQHHADEVTKAAVSMPGIAGAKAARTHGKARAQILAP